MRHGVLYLAATLVVLCVVLTTSFVGIDYVYRANQQYQKLEQELERREAQFDDIEYRLSTLNTSYQILDLYAGISPEYEWREQELLDSVRLVGKRLRAARQIIWAERGYTPLPESEE